MSVSPLASAEKPVSKPRYQRFEGLQLDRKLAETDSEPWCGVQVIDLDSGVCVHWFRIDGPVGELYDLGVVPGVVRPMALGFATNEILGLITHDPLEAAGFRARATSVDGTKQTCSMR